MSNISTTASNIAHKLILFGGVPGSGKTTIGKELAKSTAIFIDKDTISNSFTESLLIALGSHKDDRESEIYSSKVRGLEYDTMMEQAFENLALGHNVICSAPFIVQYQDNDWVNDLELQVELLGAELVKIWIQVDENTARERIIARGADRDNGKLSDWDRYAGSIVHSPPTNISNLIVIDNTRTSPATLSDQVLSITDRLKRE
jgi:predicted kinase